MRKKRMRKKRDSTQTVKSPIAVWLADGDLSCAGYVSLDQNPEILTACRRIAQLIGATTIYLMNNTADGDKRIVNELSRAVDIEPMPNMTRSTWMEAIVMTLLLYGKGNAVVVPHTWKGLLQSLEPIASDRVQIVPDGNSRRDYKVMIDGIPKDPANLCHFVYNPDKIYPWKGRGIDVSLRDLADNLKQARHTEKAFMASEYKPSIIVKVDALTEEFSSPTGRQKLLDSYVKPSRAGEPWLIPAEQFQVEQVRPLSLADLAISDTVTLDKRAVAAIIGVPPYMVGVGEYNAGEYNAFIKNVIMPLCKSIAAELTKKLLINPAWYWQFNAWSLIDYDMEKVSGLLLQGADRGFVNGDEWRDRMHLSPAGLKEYKVLENYIPYDKSGDQQKLNGGSE